MCTDGHNNDDIEILNLWETYVPLNALPFDDFSFTTITQVHVLQSREKRCKKLAMSYLPPEKDRTTWSSTSLCTIYFNSVQILICHMSFISELVFEALLPARHMERICLTLTKWSHPRAPEWVPPQR